MPVRPKQSQGRYSTRVRLGNEELALLWSFVTYHQSWLQIVEIARILINDSGSKMQLSICWSGSSHLDLRRQKYNCSSHIVTNLWMCSIGAILTRILLENLFPVIVTHSNDSSIDQLESICLQLEEQCNSFSTNGILILPLSIVLHIHWWISGRVCYMYRNNNR